jgi:RNA polymerase sigma-70 factor (ECF subfamily)
LSNKESETERAFDDFLQGNYSRVMKASYLMVRDKGIAEDIAQEAFAKAYLNWKKLWPEGNPEGWVYRVAVNLSHSWGRRVIRESKMLIGLGPQRHALGPEDLVDTDLERLVDMLPARQKQAVALHYGAGLPLEKVAAAMGCKVGTVKSCLHAARARLRKGLSVDE